MGKLPITVFWNNIRGETIYTENMTLSDVLLLLEQDERASHNMYRLPEGDAVTDVQLLEWYAAKMGTQPFAM
jgi:hypothetical protein